MSWATVAALRWGDIPAWVGAAVNLGVVLVALSPIRAAKRQRIARSRLVAASLVVPMRVVHGLLTQTAGELAKLAAMGASPKGPAYDQTLLNLKDAAEKAPPLLHSFSLQEAAWLDDKIGERLARTVGAANAAFLGLSSLLDDLAKVKWSALVTEGQVCAARVQLIKQFAFLPTNFHSTAEFMEDFTAYCDRLFPSWTQVPARRTFSPWLVLRRLSGVRLRRAAGGKSAE